jgi:CSLREA domain-containing protein
MVSHANVALNASAFTPGQASIRAYSSGIPVAAMAMHLNTEGRLGVVVLHQGQTGPSTMAPLSDSVFTVNTMIDTVDVNPGDGICADSAGNCSLRAAVMEANAGPGGSTIMLPQGVYALTIPGIDGSNASTGHLDIADGLTIVGENPDTTVIQAGTQVGSNGIPNGIDKVFSINPLLFPGFDFNLSNLTIRYGLNVSALNPFGGAFDWDAGTDGTGTLKITNCKIVNNATVITDGSFPLADGGGISLTNEFPGAATTGSVTISGSSISGNVAQDTGGGVFLGGLPMTMSNTQISNNQALDDPSSQKLGQSGGQQAGGGISIFGPGVGQTAIQNSAIFGNQAGTQGGGIFTTAGVLISTSKIYSNQASQSGGGIFSRVVNETTSVIATNITSNTAGGNGGGIEVDSGSQGNNFIIQFSRIAGNSAPTGSGLNNISGTVAAADNWWGCNQGPAASPCDLFSNTGTASFNPWLVLQNNATPNALAANSTSILTAGFLLDSTGAPITSANLGAFVGVPISFQNVVNGTLSNAQTTIQPSGTATATFTGITPGTGQADAVVDGFHATTNVIISDCSGDFILSSATPPQTLLAGGSTTYVFSVSPLSGFNGIVNFLNVPGLPGSTTASFSSPSITASGTTTLTIGTSSFTPAGNYALTVTGYCGSKIRATSVNLSVQNFTLSATAISQAIPPGNSASMTVSVAAQNGFAGNIAFSVNGLPSGATYNFNPPSLNSSGSSVLTIFTPASMPAGANLFTINAVSNGLQQSYTAVIVTSGFSLAATPVSRTVARGATASYQVNAFPIGGFNSPVTLNVSGLPGGATFSPVSIPGPGVFTLSIFTSASTPVGPSSLVVTGSSGASTATTNIALLVTSAAAPAISGIAPSEVLAGGPTFSLAVNGSNFPADAVVRINGVVRPTSVISSGQLIAAIFAADITASSHQDITIFSPSSGAYSDAVPLTVFRYGDLNFDNIVNIQDLVLLSNLIAGNLPGFDSTPADVYQDGVIDSADLTTLANYLAGNIHHLPVTPVGDFSISASSLSQTATAGSNASVVISTADTDGFMGTVKLSITGLPSGATASFAPTSIAGNGSSTLTISTSALAGNYALTITGTSGSRIHSIGITLSITAVDQSPPPPPPDPCNPATGVVMGSFCPVLQTDN